MFQNNFQELKQKLAQAKKAVIIPHRNPDGDAIGSTLALQRYLNKKQIKSSVVAPNQFPKFLKWLDGAKDVLIAEYQMETAERLILNADLIFLLDFNTLSRIENLADFIKNSKAPKVLIDHHEMPDDFDFMYSDVTAPATCQMIYQWISAMNDLDLIDTSLAECIYTGLLTDTGNFRYRSTNAKTLTIAADLLNRGLDLQKIHSNLFDTNSESRMKLLSKALNELQVFQDYRTSIIALDEKDLLEHDFQKGDTEGFVNYGLSVENMVFTIFLKPDLQQGFIKMSFRSKGEFDVNKFARKHFNGGGHKNAAGGKSNLSLEETKQKLLTTLQQYQTELNQIKI